METITIQIAFNPQTGEVGVRGPLHDKIMCYGLLEMARQAIHDHKQERPPLIAAGGSPRLDGVLRNGG